MNNTPQSNRIHIGIYGETNSGKSTLFNKLIDSDLAIVSEQKGTTTDPILKSFELIPYGPIVLIDTAGLGDDTILGTQRMRRTESMLNRTDIAIYVIPANNFNKEVYEDFKQKASKKNIKHLVAITKKDLVTKQQLNSLTQNFTNFIIIDYSDSNSLNTLKTTLGKTIKTLDTQEQNLMKGFVDPDKVVILVTPIDSAAPKGRMILPQVQVIRACMDLGIICTVTEVFTLEQALKVTQNVGLVVTDSQAFKEVSKIVPDTIPLTSFSILFANQKGDIKQLYDNAQKIKELQDGDKVLITEVCTHNVTHEDIGRHKIPTLLKKVTGKNLEFDFLVGKDFTENINDYKLIIHCGGCMINKKEMLSRQDIAKDVGMTNYGTVLAYCHGILDRSVDILKNVGAL